MQGIPSLERLKKIRTTGGHEIWAGKQVNRPVVLVKYSVKVVFPFVSVNGYGNNLPD
jgi:hypothetical protein